jgi:hypothetical protein
MKGSLRNNELAQLRVLNTKALSILIKCSQPIRLASLGSEVV